MEVNFPKTKHSKMEKPKLPVSSGPRPRQSQNQVCCRAVGKQSLSLFRFKWRSEDTISPLEDGRESLWPSLILFYIERILFTPSTTEKPWVRKIPWRRECPLQYSCLENPMDSRAWWATVYGATKSQTHLKWLSIHMCTTRTHTKLTEGKIFSECLTQIRTQETPVPSLFTLVLPRSLKTEVLTSTRVLRQGVPHFSSLAGNYGKNLSF